MTEATEPAFKPGDIVCLKSGGPPMTVKESDLGSVACIWFKESERRSGGFPENCLKLAEPDEAT